MITRRNFLKDSVIGLASLTILPFIGLTPLVEFPQADRLGRVTVGMVEVKAKPDPDSATVAKVYEDAVVPWLSEVVGTRPFRRNQRWVETPQGYIWSAYLQPVKNLKNLPVKNLLETSLGPGMWVEVTIPYIDVILANPPARSPWLQENPNPRLYFSQIFWIDGTKVDDSGQTWYRVNERYGYGDIFWANAEAFRPITNKEILPINPDVENKRIVVNIAYQTISCFEGSNEIYFAFISTGFRYNINGKRTDEWETPLGKRPIWRKLFSVHMSGGTTGGGYDIAGVSWVSLFEGNGVAIHSTFWHNNFGEEMSQGCVNASPEDAKWIFRWTNPIVAYDPGDLTVGMPGGTSVDVIES